MSEQAGIAEMSVPHQGESTKTVTVGMVGLGTVGTGVYKLLQPREDIDFRRIAVRDMEKSRGIPELDPRFLSADPFSVVRDPDIQLVIEVMGGADLARQLVTEAIQNGKHVVTANKELIAKHGNELFELARAHNVRLMFEGAVAGGIPIIMPLKLSLAANQIQEIAGIINGTTNYILTKMADEGRSYQEVLEEAQRLGFAEADPTNDVEGHDTAYKISILASIAFKKRIDMQYIYCKGISTITAQDVKLAESLGYTIKLIGLCRQADAGQVDVRVHPMLVPHSHPLASIKNEYNAVWIKGHAVGDVMFYGKGAGEMPTASAVCGDALAIVNGLKQGNDPIPSMQLKTTGLANILPITETKNRYFVRLNTADKPGVIGHLGTACGEYGVSLESIVQHGINENGTASIILVTQEVYEKQMRSALDEIVRQESTCSIGSVLRIL